MSSVGSGRYPRQPDMNTMRIRKHVAQALMPSAIAFTNGSVRDLIVSIMEACAENPKLIRLAMKAPDLRLPPRWQASWPKCPCGHEFKEARRNKQGALICMECQRVSQRANRQRARDRRADSPILTQEAAE